MSEKPSINPIEREKIASPDNTREQARALAISGVVAKGNEGYKKFHDTAGVPPPSGEQQTSNWLGYLTNLDEGVHEQSLLGRKPAPDGQSTILTGKDLFIAIAKDGKSCQATGDGVDMGTGFENAKITKLKGKTGSTVTVELSDNRVITIPVSVLQESYLITHQDVLTKNLSAEQKKVTDAYVNTATGSGPGVESLTVDEMKEVAKTTPGIEPESVSALIDHMVADAASIPDLSAEAKGKLDKLQELQKRVAGQAVVTSGDMAEMITLLTSPEITGITVDSMNKDINRLTSRIAEISSLMTGKNPEGDEWKDLNRQKSELRIELTEVTLKRNLHEKGMREKSQDMIEDFFERAQNGEFSSETLDKINASFKKGNMDEIMEEALTEMTKAGKSPEEIEAAKLKMAEYRKKVGVMAGGAAIVFLFIMLSAMKSK